MKMNVGVCTWSLENDVERITRVMNASGLNRLHLDVSAADTLNKAIAANGWTVSATMVAFPQEDYSTLETIKKTGGVVPDASWSTNRERALAAIAKTARLNVPFLSTHVGFIDHEDAAEYRTFRDRVHELADAAAEKGVTLLMETGQENAEELSAFLDTIGHPALGVNFDPANMILYGKGDPIEAVRPLAPWIKHVHVKDATASPVPNEWGQEVRWGAGDVDAGAFLQALENIGYAGAAAIEREAGDQREMDILHAAQQLETDR